MEDDAASSKLEYPAVGEEFTIIAAEEEEEEEDDEPTFAIPREEGV